MAKDINVVSICGSLRAGSLNRMLMNSLRELAPAGMTITESPSVGDMPLFNGDVLSADGVPAGASALADAVAAADGVLSLWWGFLPYYGRCGGHTVTMFIFVDQIRSAYRKTFMKDK